MGDVQICTQLQRDAGGGAAAGSSARRLAEDLKVQCGKGAVQRRIHLLRRMAGSKHTFRIGTDLSRKVPFCLAASSGVDVWGAMCALAGTDMQIAQLWD